MGRFRQANDNFKRICSFIMKYLTIIGIFISLGCQSKKDNTSDIEEIVAEDEVSETDQDDFYESENTEWDYQPLYGSYVHESNTTGFSANLEIIPEGNDLSFSLSVKQPACTGQATGIIGLAIYSENEYAGFYNNANCRMEFQFNLVGKTIRVTEIGICSIHEAGCSFSGVYRKQN